MTAIDTNVLIALWGKDDVFNRKAQDALDEALRTGLLMIAGPVYAELLAGPGRTQRTLDEFFRNSQVRIEWELPERVWRMAGEVYQTHSVRRHATRGGAPRRIIADFVIGAHALAKGCSLLTLDREFFERNFPKLTVKTFH